MKMTHILSAACSLLLAGTGLAGTTYTVGMTGVTCAGCKAHVTEAFTKLPGVDAKTIAIVDGEKPGSKTVTFTSSSAGLKKDDAVKSLGDAAKTYVVVTFETEKKKG